MYIDAKVCIFLWCSKVIMHSAMAHTYLLCSACFFKSLPVVQMVFQSFIISL